MSVSLEMLDFERRSRDAQRHRYQRNASTMSDNRLLEAGINRLWYQPFVRLAQPLTTPRLEQQFGNFQFGGQNLRNDISDIRTRLSNETRLNQIIAQQGSFRQQDTGISQSETNQVISMEEDTTLHGNWTIKNAKFRLLRFCEANGYHDGYTFMVDEELSKKTRKPNWVHHCEKSLRLGQLNKRITGEGKGCTKQIASERCALSLIQHLYQLQLIEAHIAPVKFRKTKEWQAETKVAVYKIALDEKLQTEIYELLRALRIKPHPVPENEVVKTKTKPLLLKARKSLSISDISTFEPSCIPQWCSPIEAWDPWLSCRITEGALSEMSMDEISRDLRKARFHQIESGNIAQEMLNERLKLHIFNSIGKIMDAVQNNPVVIIQGPNGCGKSTQIPQYILDTYINAGRGGECSILVVQSRRVSAISIAERVAQERGEALGASCGYSVRFDSWLPRPYGSILFCTADVVLKKLKSGLRGISHVIVDEIHERDVNVDLILLILKEMLKNYNLQVTLLSAPMDMMFFSEYFGNCPVVEISTEQPYSVKEFYLEDCIEMVKFIPKKTKPKSPTIDSDDDDMNKVIGKSYRQTTAEAMANMNEEEIPFDLIEALLTYINYLNFPGAVLIFLPGWSVISELLNRLRLHPTYGHSSYLILPLHSQLPQQEVQRVFQTAPAGVRKIILSSGIGESGITINDVVYVIDSCKIKLKRFHSHDIFFNSAVVWASKRNLEQRKGRAGFTQPGTCFRLCSRARYEKLKDDMPAAITYTSLDELALTIKYLQLGNTYNFMLKALEPPPLYLILQAETLLREIGATDGNGQLTSLGIILGQLPVRPKVGKMLVLSCLFLLGDAFCTIIPHSSIFVELLDNASFQQLNYARQHFQGNHCSDFVTLLNAFTQWQKAQNYGKQAGNYFCEEFCFSKSAMEITKNARNQLKGILQASGLPGRCVSEQDYNSAGSDVMLDMISALLLVGYYPNVCYYNMRSKEILINGNVLDVDISSLYNVKEAMQFSRSPFFVFEELMNNTQIQCKEMSMVTPLQLILFGHSRVEVVDGIVVLDGWIKLKMNLQLVSNLLALRNGLETLILEIAYKPSLIESHESLHLLVNVVKQLCSRNAVVRKEQPN